MSKPKKGSFEKELADIQGGFKAISAAIKTEEENHTKRIKGWKKGQEELWKEAKALILKHIGGWPATLEYQIIMTFGLDPTILTMLTLFNKRVKEHMGQLILVVQTHQVDLERHTHREPFGIQIENVGPDNIMVGPIHDFFVGRIDRELSFKKIRLKSMDDFFCTDASMLPLEKVAWYPPGQGSISYRKKELCIDFPGYLAFEYIKGATVESENSEKIRIAMGDKEIRDVRKGLKFPFDHNLDALLREFAELEQPKKFALTG